MKTYKLLGYFKHFDFIEIFVSEDDYLGLKSQIVIERVIKTPAQSNTCLLVNFDV